MKRLLKSPVCCGILLVMASVLTVFLLLRAADAMLPLFVSIPPEAYGFEPINGSNGVWHHKSHDFDSVARTNALGMRGPDISFDKDGRYRILAIGSSYTFGWGVDDEECWPHLLQESLKQAGVDAEVLNLGRNGASVEQYLALAYDAVPFLKPDMILVVPGQGVDILCVERLPASYHARLLLKRLVPNTVAWKKGPRIPKPAVPVALQPVPDMHDAQEAAKKAASTIYAEFAPKEQKRFDVLDSEIKHLFFSGEINPGMIKASITNPNCYCNALDVTGESTRYHIDCLAQDLREFKQMARRYHVKLIVATMPFGIYVNNISCRNYARDGFATQEGMTSHSDPDKGFRMACDAAGLPLVTVTEAFRKQADNPGLFFETDLHMTRDGERLFADSLLPHVLGSIHANPTQ